MNLQCVKLCVNTQTPLVRFNTTIGESEKNSTAPIDVKCMIEGKDYIFSPGGVTRMVYPLLKTMHDRGFVESVHWVSLNQYGPENATIDRIALSHISMNSDRIKGYGLTKETIWGTIHGLPNNSRDPSDIFWQDEYSDFTYYNRQTSERILQLEDIYIKIAIQKKKPKHKVGLNY